MMIPGTFDLCTCACVCRPLKITAIRLGCKYLHHIYPFDMANKLYYQA